MNERDVVINGLLSILFPLKIVGFIYHHGNEMILCQTQTAAWNTGAQLLFWVTC